MTTEHTKESLTKLANDHLKIEVDNAVALISKGEKPVPHVALLGATGVITAPLPPQFEGIDPFSRGKAWREGLLYLTHSIGGYCLLVSVETMLAAGTPPEDPEARVKMKRDILTAKDPYAKAREMGVETKPATMIVALAAWGARMVLCAPDGPPLELPEPAMTAIAASLPRELHDFWKEYMDRFLDDDVVVDAADVEGAPPSPLATGERGS